MNGNVRVRFAPSPTGEPHVGNIRTAVFEWLFARRHGGSLILRIEDTDQARKVEGAVDAIMDSLKWLGLDWDEGPDVGGAYGPYLQSQRKEQGIYQRVVEELISSHMAYECYCSAERLKAMREEQAARGDPPRYDGRCRNLKEIDREKALTLGLVPVVRFSMPLVGTTKVQDLVKGEVEFENNLLDDFVILKSDGYPTYHLAHMVDDHEMAISHVIRAEEWLPSLPRHWQIYEALGWTKPIFAHVPIILAPDRSKLSKRHGATSVLQYRRMGYLPKSMINFLALLGWSVDDKTEIMSTEQMQAHFSIDRIAKSPAIFNVEKLEWMNGHYIRESPDGEIADMLLEFWTKYPPSELPELPDKTVLLKIVPIIKERMKTLGDAAPLIPFFVTETAYDPEDLIQKKMDTASTSRALEASLIAIQALSVFDASALENVLRPLAEQLGLKAGQLFGTLRMAITGLKISPPLFESMEILGKKKTITSVEKAIGKLYRKGD